MCKQQMQEEINKMYKTCETLKDEIAIRKWKYQAALVYLESLCKESGLSAQVTEGI